MKHQLMKLKYFFDGLTWKMFFTELYREMNRDYIFNGAAALAFYMMLSIFPAMIFLLSLLPYLPIAIDQVLMDLLFEALPDDAAQMFTGVVEEIVQPRGGLLSFSLLFVIWTASTGLHAIMQELNRTYNVEETRPFWKGRAIAVGLMFIFVLIMLLSFAAIVFGGYIEQWLMAAVGWREAMITLFTVFRYGVITFMLLLAFAVIYYWGPNVEQKFKFITPGSVFGTLIFIAASAGFQIYVDNFGNYTATYGGLGTVVILMLWLYITGLVLLLGSEINVVIEHHHPEGKKRGERREPRGSRSEDKRLQETRDIPTRRKTRDHPNRERNGEEMA
jgi:membrane protein